MASCKDCLHVEVCKDYAINYLKGTPIEALEREVGDYPCCRFQDRSLFVELPCKIGDTVYSIYKGDIGAHIVNRLEFCTVGNNSECQDYFGTAEGIDDCDENFSFINFTKATFGKTVFLTLEEAEQALKLKERENNA